MGKKKSTNSGGSGQSKRISAQLLSVIIPMSILAIAVVAIFVSLQAKSVITSGAVNGLQQEARANAAQLSGDIEGVRAYFNGLADTLEAIPGSEGDAVNAAVHNGMAAYPDLVSDVYILFGARDGYFGSDWVPGDDYDATTRPWYINGSQVDTMTLGDPSIDMTTGEMVVCGSRQVIMKDGKTGVLSTDIQLSGLSEQASAFTPLGTGSTMMFDGSVILASPDKEQVGKDIGELSDDSFLQDVYKAAQGGNFDEVFEIKGTDGNSYYVSLDKIQGTDWILESHVKVSDVLASLYRFIYISAILAAVMVIVMAIVMFKLINSKITKPVSKLTANITRIAQGDFTVDIKREDSSKANEIAQMNNNMFEYVAQMRGTLADLQDVTQKLATEATNSKNASSDLNLQAGEQSRGMQQIELAMDDMASAVMELANQATILAQEVASLSEKGQQTRSTMEQLVTKARDGQRDMEIVQNGMTGISQSMEEMNSAVAIVGDSAQKINSIVDMINSISSQTNLLSLNASIEAARAGEAGKGFAVVAREIGQLAQNSADSTQQISDIISSITVQINELSEKSQANMAEITSNVNAVNTAGGTFEEIFRNLDETSTIVGDMIGMVSEVSEIATSMAAISEEQSASTQEVSNTATSLTTSAEQVAQNSRGVDTSAVAVSDSSDKIENIISTFRI